MSQNPDRPTPSNNNFSLVPVQNNLASGNSSNNPENNYSTNSNPNFNQGLTMQDLRSPPTLQGVLDLATRLQTSSIESPQLTNERAEFLRNALSSMTTNLVPEMQKRLDVLKEIQTLPEHVVDANLSKYEDSLEELVEFLYEIDLAQMFYQINGLNVIAPLLRSKHASLRSSTAAIIVECCKNNPFCQKLSVTDEVFGRLIEMGTSDPNRDAMFNAIAAVSAITRSNPAGISQFNKFNGLHMVEKALNMGCEKTVSKTIFLVMALCDTDETLKRKVTETNIIVTLITLLRLSEYIVKEYILRALLSITKDNKAAIQVCRQHNLRDYITSLCQLNAEPDPDPEYQDLVECATHLHKLL